MRVLNALSDKYVETGQYNVAAYVIAIQGYTVLTVQNRDMIIDMLRLCPGDNLGKRTILPAILVLAERHTEALSYAQGWIASEQAHPDGSMAPSDIPLSAAQVKQHLEWGRSEHFHSAALAAFRLWGDCELAGQYLNIAAHLNAAVLRRALGQKDRPRESARQTAANPPIHLHQSA